MNSAVTVLHQPIAKPRFACLAPAPVVRLLIVICEALRGRRALHQIRPLVGLAALAQITACVDAGLVRRTQVGKILLQMPTPSSVEAVVHLVTPTRTVACAIRLDARERSWRCSEVAVLLPEAMAA